MGSGEPDGRIELRCRPMDASIGFVHDHTSTSGGTRKPSTYYVPVVVMYFFERSVSALFQCGKATAMAEEISYFPDSLTRNLEAT